MSNATRGGCPAPFLSERDYGLGGYIGGRYCTHISKQDPGLRCCLPCPATDYIYSETFNSSYKVVEGMNVLGLICLLYLLLSWILLPVEKTRRHYLSVCLVIGAISLSLGFVIPLAAQPDQCFDDITPHDMYSSMECAWSGALIVAGGLSVGMWIFIRALSMHLQICWDVTPGDKFFYAAQGLGWGIIAGLFTATITVTGVSFRFGDACHVNSDHSMDGFWGPLLGLAGLSTIVQLATFGYCINVYLRNMWADEGDTSTQNSNGLPSYASSVRTRKNSTRAIYNRVTKVLWLQWRGIIIVIFFLADVIFFSVVFVYLDGKESSSMNNLDEIMPWLVCLVHHPTETDQCYSIAQHMLVNQDTVLAVLVMLSLFGFQCMLLLARWSMVVGWGEWFRNQINLNREFLSLDANRNSVDDRGHELGKVESQSPYPETLKTPDTAVTSPSETLSVSPSSTVKQNFLGKDLQRAYHTPVQSFSAPRAPSAMAVTRIDWDPTTTFARGGLGLHPVQSQGDAAKADKK
ncbi:uncharacterized protein K452DRAFT_294234 [Aplosporella prunicola CBS 121167]|uniref:G-protein coupled receptors family 2 profile 2 domain-containing protein n=1 Tax=Aplosporella prunicola CBS 121167 TaxID=1176127 RepID=A0A6A6BRF7_9PEZI|nr:uncharacterized protein K452DRAFT_294234 [Aplosporella prunicola CBS 121167]KAF2146682.1 hypothetical protein K452DRAFT_294234 [Aplosporella prunicola CBS 121167]